MQVPLSMLQMVFAMALSLTKAGSLSEPFLLKRLGQGCVPWSSSVVPVLRHGRLVGGSG